MDVILELLQTILVSICFVVVCLKTFQILFSWHTVKKKNLIKKHTQSFKLNTSPWHEMFHHFNNSIKNVSVSSLLTEIY